MRIKLGSLAIALAIVPSIAACGDDGETVDPGEASLAAVFPSTGFAGRTTRVQITGENAAWTAPTVSFGDGITVANVEVITPSAIFADVTVDAGATFGTRSVTVTDGEALTIADSFTVESPLEVEIIGTVAQGSVAQIVISNRDIDTPFDTTTTGDGFTEPLVYVGIEMTTPAGVDVTTNILDVQEYSITTIALIDVDAAAGPGVFSIKSGVEAASQVVSVAEPLDVAARTAKALTAAMPGTGTFGAPLATDLYEFAPGAAPQTSSLMVIGDNAMASPEIILISGSGHFSDGLELGTNFFSTELPEKVYAIVWDGTGASGYTYNLFGGSREYVTAAETALNDTALTAQTPTLPASVTATLSGEDDEDWVKITAAAEDVGKRIFATTQPGDPRADTIVEFRSGNDGATAFGTPSSDVNYHELHLSPTIPAAGTYFVRVTASDFQVPTPTTDGYSLLVWVE